MGLSTETELPASSASRDARPLTRLSLSPREMTGCATARRSETNASSRLDASRPSTITDVELLNLPLPISSCERALTAMKRCADPLILATHNFDKTNYGKVFRKTTHEYFKCKKLT